MLKKKLKSNIIRVFKAFNKMEMRILPGNIAYFFILALIPIINMILFVITRFSASINTIQNFLEKFLPSDTCKIIINALASNNYSGRIGIFSLIVLLVASNGTYAIINAANTLYKIRDYDVIRDRIKSLILLFILLLLIVFEKILLMINDNTWYNNVFIMYKVIKWPITFFLIYVSLKLIYTISPGISISSNSTTYGALFTTVIWVVSTLVFSYYLSHFANYSVIYGNLSSIIVLVIWLYLISYVFVLGIAINSVYYDETELKK